MIKKLCLIALILPAFLMSCKSVGKVVALKNCDFEYNRISDVKLPSLTALMSSSDAAKPLSLVLHLNVLNQGSREAALDHLSYIINVDGVPFVDGETDLALQIPAGETVDLPLKIQLDLRQFSKGEAWDAVLGICKNLMGIGSTPSKFKVQLKPKIDNVTLPNIPIYFKYGG